MTIQLDDPHALATHFLTLYKQPERYQLAWWNNSFLVWKGDRYIEIAEEHIRCDVNLVIERLFMAEYEQAKEANTNKDKVPTKLKVTATLVSSILQAVKAIVLIPDYARESRWIGGPHKEVKEQVFIPVKNGIIDSRQLAEEKPVTLIEHSPDWFCQNCLPMEFDAEATCPEWIKFLDRNLQRNDEQIAMLQEWFGYCLVPDPSYQKFLMMTGEGANGKSVICAALAALLGGNNVSHVPLESFGGQFALVGTLGKLANIASEIGDLDKVAEGHLKAFTAGDRMEFNRKHKSAIYAVPTARLVLSTNNNPRFADKSSGIWRRMLLLPMNVTIRDEERVYGMDRVEFWKPELPGILNWALAGLIELRKYGRFTQSEESKKALEDYRTDANPCREFLKERYEFTSEDNHWCPSQEMYAEYRKWCETDGYSPVNIRNFGKEVGRLWPESKRINRGSRESRFYAYSKIRKINSTVGDFDLIDIPN